MFMAFHSLLGGCGRAVIRMDLGIEPDGLPRGHVWHLGPPLDVVSARGPLRELAATTYKGMTYDVNHRIAGMKQPEKEGCQGLNI
jgi:hypothetical protein